MASRLRPDELLDAVRDGDSGAGDEQPERGEQRPDVGLPAVPERVREVGRAPGPPVGDHQEDLVTGVCPGMRRFSQKRRRPGHDGSGRLGCCHPNVDAERDQDRRDTIGPAGTFRLLN
jgi:hypothetical protein